MTEERETIQMIKIREYLKGVRIHPSAENVYEAVKKEIPSITLATVYRNLNKLSRNGDVLKLEVNGEYRFDGDVGMHQHCVCKSCGKIIDISNERISKNAMKNFNYEEFTATSVSIMFRGLCDKCCTKN
ncbi:MAG: transcriptional repressor [Candidatus Micrarchaeota archaeon]